MALLSHGKASIPGAFPFWNLGRFGLEAKCRDLAFNRRVERRGWQRKFYGDRFSHIRPAFHSPLKKLLRKDFKSTAFDYASRHLEVERVRTSDGRVYSVRHCGMWVRMGMEVAS